MENNLPQCNADWMIIKRVYRVNAPKLKRLNAGMCIEVAILREVFQTNADVTKGRFYL